MGEAASLIMDTIDASFCYNSEK